MAKKRKVDNTSILIERLETPCEACEGRVFMIKVDVTFDTFKCKSCHKEYQVQKKLEA